MAELDFAGEQRLHGGGAAADVDQIRVQAMFSKMTVFVGQPECADAGGQRAVGGAHWGGTNLAATEAGIALANSAMSKIVRDKRCPFDDSWMKVRVFGWPMATIFDRCSAPGGSALTVAKFRGLAKLA